jgi:hypothetical protein
MTQRDIIEMARLTVPPAWLDDRCKYLEAFAKLVAAKAVDDYLDAECEAELKARGE